MNVQHKYNTGAYMKSMALTFAISIIILFFIFNLLWSSETAEDSLQLSSGSATIIINKKDSKSEEILVRSIDGDKHHSGLVGKIKMQAGTHTITMKCKYKGPFPYSPTMGPATVALVASLPTYSKERILDFDVKAGRDYQVKMRLVSEDLFICWIEDSQTGEVVSKIHKGSFK
jgi:hypothetical protein